MSNKVEVQCFGILQQVCGARQREVDVDSMPVSISQVLEHLAHDVPDVRPYLTHTACAVGDRIVKRDGQLKAGDILVLLPPVSGG